MSYPQDRRSYYLFFNYLFFNYLYRSTRMLEESSGESTRMLEEIERGVYPNARGKLPRITGTCG